MKDEHAYGEKMVRNCRTKVVQRTFIKETFISKQRIIQGSTVVQSSSKPVPTVSSRLVFIQMMSSFVSDVYMGGMRDPENENK